jgi:hypothetical protein
MFFISKIACGLEIVRPWRSEIWFRPDNMKIVIERIRNFGGQIYGIDLSLMHNRKWMIIGTIDYPELEQLDIDHLDYYDRCVNYAKMDYIDTPFICGPTFGFDKAFLREWHNGEGSPSS